MKRYFSFSFSFRSDVVLNKNNYGITKALSTNPFTMDSVRGPTLFRNVNHVTNYYAPIGDDNNNDNINVPRKTNETRIRDIVVINHLLKFDCR